METKEIVKVYNEKGLNGLYAFLRRNDIKFGKIVCNFGLETNKNAREKKSRFVDPEKLQFHYYSRSIQSRKNKFNYNLLRGVKIVLL